MKNVDDLLQMKGNDIWAVRPNESVCDALKVMKERNIGAVLVLDEGRLAGIFSERDYARRVVLEGRTSKSTPVADVMATSVRYVKPEHTVEDCMTLMSEKHLRHLPVLDNDKLIGLISISDVVKIIVSKQDLKIKTLETYITNQEQQYRY